MNKTPVIDLGRTPSHDSHGNVMWHVHEVSIPWPAVEQTGRYTPIRASAAASRLHREGYRFSYGYIAKDGSHQAVLQKVEID